MLNFISKINDVELYVTVQIRSFVYMLVCLYMIYRFSLSE